MNAVRPSFRSSERITVPMAALVIDFSASSSAPAATSTTARLYHTASGAASQMAAARASASVSAAPGSTRRFTRPS